MGNLASVLRAGIQWDIASLEPQQKQRATDEVVHGEMILLGEHRQSRWRRAWRRGNRTQAGLPRRAPEVVSAEPVADRVGQRGLRQQSTVSATGWTAQEGRRVDVRAPVASEYDGGVTCEGLPAASRVLAARVGAVMAAADDLRHPAGLHPLRLVYVLPDG